MTIRYWCALCGIVGVSVDVPDREDSEDVRHWVGETIALVVGEDHRERSPRCSAKKITLIEIPMPAGSDELGKPPKH